MNSVMVIVSAASRRGVFRAIRQAGHDQIRWVYFGEEVSTAAACVRWLERRAKRIEIGERLRETAQRSRQAFIEYIGELSEQHHSESWWLSSLSEKNTYVSKVFLHACYVLVALRLIRERDGKGVLLFLVEDRIVRQCLCGQLEAIAESSQLYRDRFGERFRAFIRETGEFWARFVHFLGQQFGRLLIARMFANGAGIHRKCGTPVTLLHSWVDRRSFDESGAYRSINFGDLERYLVSQGRTVAIVPGILRTLPFHAAIRALIRSRVPFLLPQRFLRMTDVLREAFRTMARPRPIHWPPFEGVDISPLIEEDRRQDWLKGRERSNALYMAAVRRWREASIPIKSFIYTFENHIWEKAYCLAFREHYPNVHLIGYQDANLPGMALNFFASQHELQMLPFPDILITNGRYSFELLVRSGYRPSRLRCGGALRYKYLTAPAKKCKKPHTSQAIVKDGELLTALVTLSMVESLACELLWKVLHAFSNDNRIEVVLKCHPGLPFSFLSKRLGVDRLPQNFHVSERSVRDLLLRSTMLLYMDSTTSLEALGLGVPLIHVGSDLGLDIDPLDSFPELRQTVREPEQLFQTAHRIMDQNKRLEEITAGRPELISHFFGQVDDLTYGYFLYRN